MPNRHLLEFNESLKSFKTTVSVYTHAGLTMGYGHIMRCLAVAEALRNLGVGIRFIMDSTSDRTPAEAAGYFVMVLRESELTTEYFISNLNPEDGPLLLDSYAITSNELEKVRAAGFGVAIFDDGMRLKNYPCDLVIDSAPGAKQLPYRGLPQTQFCLGADYFPVRREFVSARRERSIADQVKIIIVSFGGSDNDDVTSTVLKAMAGIDGYFQILTVLGPAYIGQACEFTKIDKRIQIVRNVSDMAALMVTADVAVCSSGGTALEFAYLGIPMVLLSLSPDQLPIARALVQAGEHLNDNKAINDTDVARAVSMLIADKPKRQSMHLAGPTLIDGRGSERVASAIFSIISRQAFP